MPVPIVGYLDRFSVRPGGQLAVKVSSTSAEPYQARLVRIRCADPNPVGPGMKVEDLGHVFEGTFPSRVQAVQLGSYGRVPHAPTLRAGAGAFTWSALVRPSKHGVGPAAVLAKGDPATAGVCLAIRAGGVVARVATTSGAPIEVATSQPLRLNVWYRVWLACDPASGRVLAGQAPLVESPLFDRALDLFQVRDAGVGLRRGAGLDEVRDGDGGEEADDRDDDHDFYEGKAGFAVLDGLHFMFRCWLRCEPFAGRLV